MVSTFTPNVQFEEPARGDYVGTWDLPVNANMTLADLLIGGTNGITVAASSTITLASSQAQAKTLIFSSTLQKNTNVIFPSSIAKTYELYNYTTGNASFTLSVISAAGTGAFLSLPPGEGVDVLYVGPTATGGSSLSGFFFKNLGRVGEYYDFAGTAVPGWITNCTTPPYLNCTGTTFSSAVYPNLRDFLGSNTLPDARGRTRAALNQTTGRMTSAGGGVDGNTISAAGGVETITLASSQMPAHAHSITDPGHSHSINAPSNDVSATAGGVVVAGSGNATVQSHTTGITINSAGGSAQHINVQPSYIGGITMIRAC